MYSRILVPLDGSELAEAVLSTAHALAGMGPGTLYLVRAVAASNEPEARRYLKRLAVYLREHGVVVEAQALRGQPVAVVVEEAARREVDLIVMSTHGRAGAGRWVLGSVADEVLHRTACPVLLLRTGQAGLAARPRRVLVPLDGSELAEHALAHATSLVGT